MTRGFDRNGEFIRNAYIIYEHPIIRDMERQESTNYKLYIEGSLNSINDINYEVWLLRTYFHEIFT